MAHTRPRVFSYVPVAFKAVGHFALLFPLVLSAWAGCSSEEKGPSLHQPTGTGTSTGGSAGSVANGGSGGTTGQAGSTAGGNGGWVAQGGGGGCGAGGWPAAGGSGGSGGSTTYLVGALYDGFGTNWNDYVRNDGASVLAATDTECQGDEAGGYNACLHGGELRLVQVPGYADCSGLTAVDGLDAFDWVCDPSTNPVRMVSTGLKWGKGLSDLVDYGAAQWCANIVTVKHNGMDVLATPAAVWWSNPIVVNNDGGVLDQEGTIYLTTKGVLSGYSIEADRVALVIEPGLTVYRRDDYDEVVKVKSRKFAWVEGAVNALVDVDEVGISFGGVYGTRFSVMRHVVASGGYRGVQLMNSGANNKLVDVSVFNNATGFYAHFATNNTVRGLTAFNNSKQNVYIHNGCTNNTFLGLTSFASQLGVKLEGATDNILLNVTVVNNGSGIAHSGIHMFASSDNNLWVNTVVANNYGSGIYLDHSSRNAFQNVTSADNAISGSYSAAFRFEQSSYNYFTGVLKAGRRQDVSGTWACHVEGGSDPGLSPAGVGQCDNDGGSDASITNGVTLATAFVGKASTDAVNQHGSAGLVAYDDVEDWTHFENELRGWGLDGTAFPAADNMSRCVTGDSCRIWDWSLAQADAVLLDVHSSLPTGSDAMRHVWNASTSNDCLLIPNAYWGGEVCSVPGYSVQPLCELAGGDWVSDKCSSLFLRNAVELLEDEQGNNNGLCESDETCVATPNIGSYQGHGGHTVVGTIGEGTILERITLVQRANNGR